MNKLPNGWIRVPIGAIAGHSAQRVPTANERFRYIDIASIDRDRKRIGETQELSGANAPSRARKVVRTGDVLVSMTRPNLNAVALVPATLDGQIASTGFDVLRPQGIDPRWLYCLVRSEEFMGAMSGLVQGALYPAVRSKDVRSFVVPVAPFAEQRRILDKLEAVLTDVERCRTRLEHIPALLKRFREAVLEAAVSGRLTKEWRELRARDLHWKSATLHDVGIVSGGLTKNGRRNGLPYRKPYLRVANVYQDRLELDDVAEIGLTPEEWAKTALRSGDLLIVEGNGSLDQIGRVALWEGQISECSHQNHLIRWRSTGVSPRFILYWLMSPRGRTSLMDLASTTTGLHTLSISKIQRVPVQVPPKDEQTEIVRRVEELFSLADALVLQYEAAIHHVDSLTPAVLSKAFRGQLMPQDPGDEPARGMLERMKLGQKAVAKNGSRQRLVVAHGRSPQQSVQEGSGGEVRERKRA